MLILKTRSLYEVYYDSYEASQRLDHKLNKFLMISFCVFVIVFCLFMFLF